MADKKLNKDEKQEELVKYRDLVLATLDYYIDNKEMQIKTADFDSTEHYKGLKTQTAEHYQKGRLTRLKQWFSGFDRNAGRNWRLEIQQVSARQNKV